MRINETYNIHKKINCMFPFFKSKFLCKKGIHNYQLNHTSTFIPETYIEDVMSTYEITRVIHYQLIDRTILKCFCCGKEEELNE